MYLQISTLNGWLAMPNRNWRVGEIHRVRTKMGVSLKKSSKRFEIRYKFVILCGCVCLCITNEHQQLNLTGYDVGTAATDDWVGVGQGTCQCWNKLQNLQADTEFLLSSTIWCVFLVFKNRHSTTDHPLLLLLPTLLSPVSQKPGTCHSSAFSISYSHSVRHHWGRLVGRYLSPPDDTLETQRLETGGRRCRRLRGCSSDCSVSELQIGFVEQQLKWRVQGKINGHGIWINI